MRTCQLASALVLLCISRLIACALNVFGCLKKSLSHISSFVSSQRMLMNVTSNSSPSTTRRPSEVQQDKACLSLEFITPHEFVIFRRCVSARQF